jgi:dihydroxy-acid dehydratase
MDNTRQRLRSADWFDDPTHPVETAIYVERYLNFGITPDELRSGKPIVGIAQSGSDLAPCNRHHLQLALRVREGIRDAGGIPFEFPVHPLAEMGRRPTAALDRNLCFLGLVEILHGYPLDGVVLTTGCDKTTPALIMAAAAVDLPAIVLSGGPMLNGWDGARRVGSGAVIWRARDKLRCGEIDFRQFMEEVASSTPSAGHCNTMGTALTMNCLSEALGMSLPGCAAIPAPHRERAQMAYQTGRRIVGAIREDLRPSKILTRSAFLNAIRVCTAIGGSTNAPIHLQAIAECADAELSIRDWHTHGEHLPLLVNCQPSGHYLGEDFHRAGGLAAVMGELLHAGLADGEALAITGRTIAEEFSPHRSLDADVIRSVASPMRENAGFAVLSGNLFRSAIMKKSVISAEFRQRYLNDPAHPNVVRLRAIVFEGPEDYHERIEDASLGIDELCLLVIRNCGPVGYPGSAEVVNMAPPVRLLRARIASLPCMGDGRQSGTSDSPSILNISPEAAVGGDLGIVVTGDCVEIDLNRNCVSLLVDEEEMRERRKNRVPLSTADQTPWQEIYRRHVSQLDEGASLVLRARHTRILQRHGTPRHSH